MLDGKSPKKPLTIRHDATLRRAAEAMKTAHVGSLIVVDDEARVVGIVTDRDLCLRAVAFDRDPDEAKVAGCMTEDVRTLPLGTDLADQINGMRAIGARRIPLVDDTGVAQEIAALDDMLLWAAARLSELAGTAAVGRGQGNLREPASLLRDLEAFIDSESRSTESRLAVPRSMLMESIERLREGLVPSQVPPRD